MREHNAESCSAEKPAVSSETLSCHSAPLRARPRVGSQPRSGVACLFSVLAEMIKAFHRGKTQRFFSQKLLKERKEMSLNNRSYEERRENRGLVENPQIRDWAGTCRVQQVKREGEGGWALAGTCQARNHATVCHQQYCCITSLPSPFLSLDFDRAPQSWMHFHLQPINISSL